jgi:caa(3)-type oxidase subunit IV
LSSSATKGSAIVWAALVVFTVLSFVLGGEHVIDSRTLAAVTVVGIAAFKIHLVGLHFMEIKGAPAALRVAFEGYCIALFVVLLGIYILA